MRNKLNVITQYCNTANMDRQNEFDFCVMQNIANADIESIHLLNESHTIVPESIKNNEKIKIVDAGQWLTYKFAIDYANENLKNKVVCLSNLDVYLHHGSNWPGVVDLLKNNSYVVFCQSRHELQKNGSLSKDPSLDKLGYLNSQDAWLWYAGYLKIDNCDFKIGLSGCDNAIADRFNKAGYQTINSPNIYKIVHCDICRGKNGENFINFHANMKTINSQPENEGHRLLPDIDKFKSIDEVASLTGMTALERYSLICDIFSKRMTVQNK